MISLTMDKIDKIDKTKRTPLKPLNATAPLSLDPEGLRPHGIFYPLPFPYAEVPSTISIGSAEISINAATVNTGTGVAQTLTTLASHILLATDATNALTFTSPASIGSATLTAPDQDHPTISGSTSDEVEEEENDAVEEDFAIEGDDGTVLSEFVLAQTDLENVLPGSPCISGRLLNPLDGNGQNPFYGDLMATLEGNYDFATQTEADMSGTREERAAQQAYNE
jgi:hypothetical protein